MGYRVIIQPSARRDLRAIVHYISLDSPARGVSFGQFLISSVERLSDFPELGRVVPEFGNPSFREIVVRSYRIIYAVHHAERRLDVLRFWHGARGTPQIQAD